MLEVSSQQRVALADALRRVGAPGGVAVELAGTATLEMQGDLPMLCLNGNCAPVEGADDLHPVDDLAENCAADNAEAFDRQQRGESGYSPWWPLPGRRSRG